MSFFADVRISEIVTTAYSRAFNKGYRGRTLYADDEIQNSRYKFCRTFTARKNRTMQLKKALLLSFPALQLFQDCILKIESNIFYFQ